MRLVVGLGNPGPKYERNRHNVGFMAADAIVRRHGLRGWLARFQGQTAEGTIAGEKVLVLKPATFMNESGRAVGEAMRFFKLDPSDVIVLYDELDLKSAKLKVKQGGGNGGHNGLKSLDAHIGADYWRVRIGIGHPGDKAKVTGYVLGDFAKAEWPDIERLLDGISDRFDLLIAGGASDFMSKLAMDLNPPADKPAKAPPAKAPPAKGAESEDPPPSGLGAQLRKWLGTDTSGDSKKDD